MSRLPCSFCLCSLATNIADIFFHYLYYTAEHQAEQWSRSLVHNIKCTCFSISAIHPMFENTGILALFVKVKELAAFFDASPSYDESDIRFINRIEGASAHDDLGPTAMEVVGHAVGQFEDEEFSALWRSLSKQENQNG